MPRSREQSSGPSQVPGWVVRSNDAIDGLLLLIQVTLTWWVLSLLGLLVVGIIPATCAAADVFAQAAEDRRPRIFSAMWESFRTELVRANVRALPFAIVQVSALAAIVLALSGRGGGPVLMLVGGVTASIALGWTTISLAVLTSTPRVRRQDLMVSWRLTLLSPGALPVPGMLLVVVLILWGALCLVIPPLSVLLGAGGAAQAARSMLGRRMEALMERLSPAAPQGDAPGE